MAAARRDGAAGRGELAWRCGGAWRGGLAGRGGREEGDTCFEMGLHGFFGRYLCYQKTS